MDNNTCIHPLAADKALSGKIRFTHSDGKEHSFYSVVNRLTGSRLSAFDSNAPTIDNSIHWVKSVFRDIRSKSKGVLEVIGDF